MSAFFRVVILIGLGAVIADPALSSSITIENAFARASIGTARNSAAFMSITNHSDKEDRLLGVKTKIASKSSLHNHINDNGIMKMRQVEYLIIAGNNSFELKPGGFHIMLLRLKAPLIEGNQFNLTLIFKNAGEISVSVRIKKLGAMSHIHKKKHTH